MIPELLLTYEYGETEFRVYKVGATTTYFLKVGAMGLELNSRTLDEVIEILTKVRHDKDFLEAQNG